MMTDKRFGTTAISSGLPANCVRSNAEEMDLLRKAVEISCIGQNEVMKAVRPRYNRKRNTGLRICAKYSAENAGIYHFIVGAGNNGCVLHYEEQ